MRGTSLTISVTGILLAALCVASSRQTSKPGPITKEDAPAQWEKILKEALAPFPCSLAIDMPGEELRPRSLPSGKAPDQQALERLSWLLDRDLVPCGGAWAMKRPWVDVTRYGSTTSALLMEWLMGIDAKELSKLFRGGSSFASLSPEGKKACANIAGSNGGVSALISQGQAVGVKGFFQRRMVLTHPSTGERLNLEIERLPESLPEPPDEDVPVNRPIALKPDTGPFDFGEGRVLALHEVERLVRDKSKTTLLFDPRLNGNKIFLKGKFSEEGILKALESIAAARPVERRPWKRPNRLNLLKQMFQGPLKDLLDQEVKQTRDKDFLEGKEVTLADLAESYPGAAAYAKSYGLPMDMKVQLSFGVGVVLHAPGSAESINGRGWRNGVPVPALEPNRTGFVITP